MDIIEKDYQHVLRTHINVLDNHTLFRQNAFKFFREVVHYGDDELTIKKLGCTVDRTTQMLSQVNSNQKTSDDKDVWKKQQKYIQRQLDICHSYLVHNDKTKQQNMDYMNKRKYISVDPGYAFGVSHEHHHLEPIFNSIYQESMNNRACKLTDTNFEHILTKAIQKREVALHHLHDGKEPICKYYSKQYKIIRNDPIGIRHILAIIIYCDMSSFCTAIRATYRKEQGNETIEQ
eukprot:344884_1